MRRHLGQVGCMAMVLATACTRWPWRSRPPALPPVPAAVAAAPAAPAAPRPPVVEAPPLADEPGRVRTTLMIEPLPDVMPPVTRFVLANGLRVLVAQQPESPVVSFRMAIRAGGMDELREKRGLASFVAAMLARGAKGRSAADLAEELGFYGATLEARADADETIVTCQAVAASGEVCSRTLPEVVAWPAFAESEIRPVRDRLERALRAAPEDARAFALLHLDNLLWGEDHPRGWPTTPESLRAIAREDLVSWHATYFKPNNAMLAVVGNVNPKVLAERLGRAFSGWREGELPTHASYVEPSWTGWRVRLIDRPDQPDAVVALGHPGIAIADPGEVAALLVNQVLGGGRHDSRFAAMVKASAGGLLGASSAFERSRTRGAFRVVVEVARIAEVMATTGALVRELIRLHEQGPTTDELARAATALAGQHVRSLERSADVAEALLTAELSGQGEAAVRQAPARLVGTAKAAAAAAAMQRLDPGGLAVAIVGPANQIAPQLALAGIPFEAVTASEPISRRDRQAARLARRGPADPKLAAEGMRLLDEALDAAGGGAKLGAIRTLVARGTITVTAGGQSLTGDLTRTSVLPDRLAVDVFVPQFASSFSLRVVPAAVWQRYGGQPIRDLVGDLADEARAGLFHDRNFVLQRHHEDGVVVEAAGSAKVRDRRCDVVTLRRRDGRDETRIFLDAATHTIARLEYEEGGMPSREDYDDYRRILGLLFPFHLRAEGSGRVVEETLSEIRLDGEVSPRLFERGP